MEKAEFFGFINEFLQFSQSSSLHKDLTKKIRNFIETRFSEEKLQNSKEKIANFLSKPLKDSLLIDSNFFLLKKIPILSKNFSENCLKKLANEMKEIQYFPEELIYKENDLEDPSLFIVLKGEIELFLQKNSKKEEILKKITNNEFFGEIALFSNEKRESSAKSKGFCSLFYIRKEDFLRSLKENNEDYEKYCQIKEKMLIYKEFNDFSLECDNCFEKNHLKFDCFLKHLKCEKTEIIKKLLDSKPQIRQKYKRKSVRKKNALCFVKKLKKSAENFQDNNIIIEDYSGRAYSNISREISNDKLTRIFSLKEGNLDQGNRQNFEKNEKNHSGFY